LDVVDVVCGAPCAVLHAACDELDEHAQRTAAGVVSAVECTDLMDVSEWMSWMWRVCGLWCVVRVRDDGCPESTPERRGGGLHRPAEALHLLR
jgi:hypothetical protein